MLELKPSPDTCIDTVNSAIELLQQRYFPEGKYAKYTAEVFVMLSLSVENIPVPFGVDSGADRSVSKTEEFHTKHSIGASGLMSNLHH